MKRILIEKLHCERHPGVRKIAEEIGRDKSTVSREPRRGLHDAIIVRVAET